MSPGCKAEAGEGAQAWTCPASYRGCLHLRSRSRNRKEKPGLGGDRGQESQVPSASKPRVLAMAGKLVASVAMDPGQGSTASETRGGIGIHQELYLQVKTHLCTGCAHEGQGRTAPCPPNVTPLESLPSCSARLPQAPSIQIPIARKSLPAFFPPSLPSLAPVRPGALLSIFLQGQAVLSCLS